MHAVSFTGEIKGIQSQPCYCITLIGIVAGAYSGASLGQPVGERLAALGIDAELADELGFAVVIVLTTYFSLTVGELAPKQIKENFKYNIYYRYQPTIANIACLR